MKEVCGIAHADIIEQRLRAGLLPPTATLADVLPERVRPLLAEYVMSGARTSAFIEALEKCERWTMENPELWDLVWSADADAANATYIWNDTTAQALPPIFTAPLAPSYGIEVHNADTARRRSDTGRKHKPRKYAVGWRTQADVAADFNRAKFTPEKGAKPKGGVSVETIKRWDTRYHDATHAEPRCGYHGELRTTHDEQKYWAAVGAWRDYWQGWRVAFKEWRKTHKASPVKDFKYRPSKTVRFDTALIGRDTGGNKYGTPDGTRTRKP